MDFTQLYYFQAAAKSEHFTRAAESLHISQPALSAVINRLEKELGVPLFDHTGRNVILNQYGKVFLSMTDTVLNEYTQALNQISLLQATISHTLHIAITGLHFSNPIIKRFLIEHPDISITQTLIASEDIPSVLKRDHLDFVVGSGKTTDEGIASCTLWNEKLVVAVPPAHPLNRRKTARLEEFSQDKFICLPKGFAFRNLTDSLCRQAGFSPEIAIECFPDQMEEFIRQGIGVAITSESTVKNSDLPIYRNAIVLENENCVRSIKLFWDKKYPFRPIAKTFFAYVSQSYKAKTP